MATICEYSVAGSLCASSGNKNKGKMAPLPCVTASQKIFSILCGCEIKCRSFCWGVQVDANLFLMYI